MIDDLLQQGGLSLDRLQSFCRVAEAGGVTRAAKGDPARQSLFSRQIKELEEFFGVELVRRSGRGVALTEAGRRLHALAREQLAGLQDFKHECARERALLSLAAGDSVIQWVLLPKLPGILAKLPSVALRVLNLSSTEIAGGLADGTLDLGIIRAGAAAGKVESVSLGSLQFSLFVPRGLAAGMKSAEPALDAAARLPMATLEGEGVFRSELERLTRRKKSGLNIQIELSSFPLVAKAVQTGVCAAVLPSLARNEFDAGDVVELRPSWLRPLNREMVLAWNPRLARIRPSLSKALPVFKTACRLE
jgi:DNA-binding transcriptional LysR family regulator